MTRLLTTGFETGDVAELGIATNGSGGAMSVVNTTPTPRAGSYCLKSGATASSWNATYQTFTFPTSKTEVWIRFAFYCHVTSGELEIARLLDSAVAVQTSLSYSVTDGLLRIYRGASSVLLATASISFPQNTWHAIEWRTLISSATTGTSEVWLDGTQVGTFSGDNSNTATLNVQSLRLGMFASPLPTATGLYLAYDDIVVNDTAGTLNNARPGDGRVVLLSPSGAGSSTAFTRGGTDTGANWSQQNELPPSMAQYVTSSTVAARDLYAMSNLGVAVTSINVVEEVVLAQNSDAGAGSIGLTVKSGATTNEGTAQALGTSAAYLRQQYETDPNTGVAWTSAAVDAVEAGVTVR